MGYAATEISLCLRILLSGGRAVKVILSTSVKRRIVDLRAQQWVAV